MNKKTMAMAASLAIGGSLLFGAVLTNASQLSGYETYKNAVKDTKNLQNETVDLKASLTDNGESLLNVTSNLKLNESANAMSKVTTITSGNTTQTESSYEQDGKRITKNSNSDQYYVRDDSHSTSNSIKESQNPVVEQSMEVVADTLAGSMQNKVNTTANPDGTKTVAINLGENDVTPLVNALTSLVFTAENHRGSFHHESNDSNNTKDLKDAIPQLQSNIKVVSVTSTGSINKDDIITDQTAKIEVSGTDAQGTQHDLIFNLNLNLSNINSTTPDKIDLTGKQVTTMSFHKE
ncbi:hypothetical protein Desaci_4205 [Desulfosporosinus acidiphilus SJ4]|uniref:Uncharacterized protein n=1 Tax=Desulfosporosinus acidiphilus (strain DSM 22704 / JCM 16185 / SJ4) TaxID=646529 RepID=I4DB90_DESAJ|nr:hypothetical protein [Desulfosporosinus acidiphilus]AFM43064.1 hypothetical protein Desaci_4205 [Desulfosporosinus acidiphilus SJ4]